MPVAIWLVGLEGERIDDIWVKGTSLAVSLDEIGCVPGIFKFVATHDDLRGGLM